MTLEIRPAEPSVSDIRFLRTAPVYPVEDVESAVEWYTSVLGFESLYLNRDPEGDDPTNYAVLARGEVRLHLVRRAEAAPFEGRAMALFEIDDVDALHDVLREKQVFIQAALQDQPWGRDFSIEDPDGNRVWFNQPG